MSDQKPDEVVGALRAQVAALQLENEQLRQRLADPSHPLPATSGPDAQRDPAKPGRKAHKSPDAGERDALRTSERKLSNAMQIARLGYWEYDVDTNLFTFDDLFYAIFRTSAEAIGGYTMSPEEYVRRFLHPDDVFLVEEENRKALQATDPHFSRQLEHRIVYADGEIGYIAVRYFIVKDEHGRTIKTYGANQDITDRKRIEDELRAAEQRAVAASEAKSEFLANMSHEIRTPMTAILGYADVLLERYRAEGASTECVAAAQTIKRNGHYLLELINGILDLSKIEAGKFEVARLPCSPCHVIADIASLMRVRAQRSGVDLTIEYDGPMPETIITDPTSLRQILINILGNAFKFTEAGSVTLRTHLDHAESRIVFDIIDTGIGMPAGAATDLFQPFTQLDMSAARQYGGSGLGLAISRRLAQLLGGDVALVKTTKGVGTHFRVTVAAGLLKGVAMLDDPQAATVIVDGAVELPTDSLPANALANRRILLAEDGLDNQRLITHILRKQGAQVTVAENGQIAMDLALGAQDKKAPFDVILMDMQMPVMDGYTAASRLREAGYSGQIIALTANAMEQDREKCLAAGCDEYTTKPIDQRALIQILSSPGCPGAMGKRDVPRVPAGRAQS